MISNEEVVAIKKSLKRSADYKYFFEKIETPDWLNPLHENGFFEQPPSPEKDGKYIQHTEWVESKYLVKVADKAPLDVARIILSIPNTDNEKIHEDYVTAAARMDSKNAIKIAKKEIQWVEHTDDLFFLYPEKAANLIIHLAGNNEFEMAVAFTEKLLRIKKSEQEDKNRYFRDVKIKFSVWTYGRVVNKLAQHLIAYDAVATINLFCTLLENSIDLMNRNGKANYDYSVMWRPTIEDNEQNLRGKEDVSNILINAVRDASLLAGSDSHNLHKVIAVLRSKKSTVFERIAIHVLTRFPGLAPDLVQGVLSNKNCFDNYRYSYEYTQLAKSGFNHLEETQKEKIFSWIEEGPEITSFLERVEKRQDRPATANEISDYSNSWRRDKLYIFTDNLPNDLRAKYDALVRSYGEPNHPEFSSYHRSWIGPTSPKSKEDLEKLPVPEIIKFLKSWKPTDDFMSSSEEGLSRELSELIKETPTKFISYSELFVDLDPTYVRPFFDGIRNTSIKYSALSWEPILFLADWVMKQPREIIGRTTEYSDLDPGWVWTRLSIARLLSQAVKKDNDEDAIPYKYRQKIWQIIEQLMYDPDPTNEDYTENNLDPITVSINSVRGEALHAAINYGLWVYRKENSGSKSGLANMPEIEETLNNHLNPSLDPSYAIRAVYGQWFPWLHLIDRKWAKEHINQIFQEDSPEYWEAGWDTYITFCRPYDELLSVLETKYRFAIGNLQRPSIFNTSSDRPDQHLIEHLIAFFIRGHLSQESNLIMHFFEHAKSNQKKYALEYIGRCLRDLNFKIDETLERRLVAFWEWRWAAALSTKDLSELDGFCWWFSAGKLNAEWSLKEFRNLLTLNIPLTDIYFAVDELMRLADNHPLMVLNCVDLMLNQLNRDGVYFNWLDETKEILQKMTHVKDEIVIDKTNEIIHKLGAMGYFDFRELIISKPEVSEQSEHKP